MGNPVAHVHQHAPLLTIQSEKPAAFTIMSATGDMLHVHAALSVRAVGAAP
jgi:hypothetical protein